MTKSRLRNSRSPWLRSDAVQPCHKNRSLPNPTEMDWAPPCCVQCATPLCPEPTVAVCNVQHPCARQPAAMCQGQTCDLPVCLCQRPPRAHAALNRSPARGGYVVGTVIIQHGPARAKHQPHKRRSHPRHSCAKPAAASTDMARRHEDS